jgi:hypothetical protein
MRHDEAAIATHIHAGQDVCTGGYISTGVTQDHMDPTAGCEGANRIWQALGIELRQRFHAAIASVKVENDGTAIVALDEPYAEAWFFVEPAHDCGCISGYGLELLPLHGWHFFAWAHRYNGPSHAGVIESPIEGCLAGIRRWG